MIGISDSGYQTCASEPTTSGVLVFAETVEECWVFTCDRHDVVLSRPRPLTRDDVDELNRRIRLADTAG